MGISAQKRNIPSRCASPLLPSFASFLKVPNHQATEGKALNDPETKYYDDLRERLDLVLTFTEHGA
jgi:hypothetical protein